MSAGQFREVDPDLLADFVGGALDGTPDEAVVARLIMDDPAWAQAHAALAAATRDVRADLAAWGATAEPMPLDVADRLSAALVEADLRRTVPEAGSVAPAGTLCAVPGLAEAGGPTAARSTRQPARARRRWSRWAAPIAVAAGVAAFAGVAITQLTPPGDSHRADTTAASGGAGERSSAREGAPASGPERTALSPGVGRLVSSGTDYTSATLSSALGGFAKDTSARPMTAQDAPDGSSFPAVPPALRRLADRAALTACLDAVTAAHGHGPLAVELVDYASFEGSPAVVVAFADGAGERWVWVAGPGCGRAEAGADTRHRTRVG